MAEKLKLSSIIIARDEEKNIGRCIESQINIIDNIVLIIDSRTKDLTLQIASSYKNVDCEVVEWQGYSKTKTYAVSKTKYDWVLWIDADEELTGELRDELKYFKENIPQFNAYDIARRAFFLGKWIKHSGWYPSRVTRLFNKKMIHFDEKEVHEGLIINCEIGHLKYDLNHYTDPSIEHYFSKFNTYTSLAASELYDNGKHASLNDIILRPIFLFLKMYIFRFGFLDGINGLILAIFSSAYVFTKYCKLWELNGKKSK
jgi:glycosyltransferase involved in cell wall biosynthesis